MSCNFDMKSYLWFQSNSRCEFMKSRGWFQTKLHSTQFNRNCSPLSPIIHSHLHLIRALFVFSLVKMDNVRQGQRIQIVHNLLTRANEQITKYRREKMHFTLFSKYLENRSKIVRFNLQFYYLLTGEKMTFHTFRKIFGNSSKIVCYSLQLY